MTTRNPAHADMDHSIYKLIAVNGKTVHEALEEMFQFDDEVTSEMNHFCEGAD